MPKKDPRIDAYIAKSADLAKPILEHLRKVVHAGCPDVVETMKWQFPHFDHKGVMCGMAAFKQQCAFGFWKAELVFGRDNVAVREAMGHFGRITKVSDLPDETTLIGYVRKAVKLNKKKPQPPKIPDYFAAAWRKMLRRERYSRISARAIKGNTWSGLPVPNATRRVSND
jgi:hypothetical protein